MKTRGDSWRMSHSRVFDREVDVQWVYVVRRWKLKEEQDTPHICNSCSEHLRENGRSYLEGALVSSLMSLLCYLFFSYLVGTLRS